MLCVDLFQSLQGYVSKFTPCDLIAFHQIHLAEIALQDLGPGTSVAMPAWTRPLAAEYKERRPSTPSKYSDVKPVVRSGFNELRARAQNQDARPQARFQHGEPFKRIKVHHHPHLPDTDLAPGITDFPENDSGSTPGRNPTVHDSCTAILCRLPAVGARVDMGGIWAEYILRACACMAALFAC